MPSPSPVFVMGATGRMGHAITDVLVGDGVPVRAGVRSAETLAPEGGVQPVRFDLLDPDTWAAAVQGCASMFVMWPPGTSHTDVSAFIDTAADLGVSRVAFLSVLGAEQMGFLPHRKIELHLLESPVSTVLLRSGYFMQNLSTMHRDDIRLRDQISLPTGDGTISMVDVLDVARAAVVGLVDHTESVAWDLTGPSSLSAGDIAEILSGVLDRPIHNDRPGILRFYREQTGRGTERGLALFMIAEYTHARLGFAGRIGDGVQQALDREPTSFLAFANRERKVWAR